MVLPREGTGLSKKKKNITSTNHPDKIMRREKSFWNPRSWTTIKCIVNSTGETIQRKGNSMSRSQDNNIIVRAPVVVIRRAGERVMVFTGLRKGSWARGEDILVILSFCKSRKMPHRRSEGQHFPVWLWLGIHAVTFHFRRKESQGLKARTSGWEDHNDQPLLHPCPSYSEKKKKKEKKKRNPKNFDMASDETYGFPEGEFNLAIPTENI